MYVLGVDIPLVELIIGVGIIGVIILLEITIILVLITRNMKNSKKLETQIGELITKLMRLEGQELKEIEKLHDLTQEEKSLISRIKKLGVKPEKKPEKALTPAQRKKLYKQMTKKTKKKNVLLESVDNFLKRWKK